MQDGPWPQPTFPLSHIFCFHKSSVLNWNSILSNPSCSLAAQMPSPASLIFKATLLRGVSLTFWVISHSLNLMHNILLRPWKWIPYQIFFPGIHIHLLLQGKLVKLLSPPHPPKQIFKGKHKCTEFHKFVEKTYVYSWILICTEIKLHFLYRECIRTHVQYSFMDYLC